MKFLKKADYIGYVIAELFKYIKISMHTYKVFLNGGLLKHKKRPGTSFRTIFF